MNIKELEEDLGRPLDYYVLMENLKGISGALETFSDDIYDMELDDIYSDILYYQHWIEQIKDAVTFIHFKGEL